MANSNGKKARKLQAAKKANAAEREKAAKKVKPAEEKPIKYTITMASHMMEVTPPSTVERSFILLSGSSPALLYFMIFEAVFTATVSAAPTTKMSHVTVQPP